jgi:hypothetical protein
MSTMDDALSPYVRYEIKDIMYEVRLVDMNMDELCDLLKLMTEVRQRVRADRAAELRCGSTARARLKLVHPVANQIDGWVRP